jgi:hypothetical protein
VSRISEIANTVATGQRCDVEKDSTTPGNDHSINVMLLRAATQEGPLRECANERAAGGVAFSVYVTISVERVWIAGVLDEKHGFPGQVRRFPPRVCG